MILRRTLSSGRLGSPQHRQMFTASQAARALRPVFFAVHPDLFGSHPDIRSINEESLKVLNGYISGLFSAVPLHLPPSGIRVTFFVRPTSLKTTVAVSRADSFRRVELQLSTGDAFDAVRRVLEEFQLSTDHLVPPKRNNNFSPTDWQHLYNLYRSNLDAEQQQQDQYMWQSFTKAKKKSIPTLTEALQKYGQDSISLTLRETEIEADIKELGDRLCQGELSGMVGDIQWLSGWASLHRKSVLKNLCATLKTVPDLNHGPSLSKLILVLSNISLGLSANGTYVLAQDETPQHWISAVRHIQSLNPAKVAGIFDEIQLAENHLSTFLLRRIQFQRPPRTKAVTYLSHLSNLNQKFGQLKMDQLDPQVAKETVFTLQVGGSDSDLQISQQGVINIPPSCDPLHILNYLESCGHLATSTASKWSRQQTQLDNLQSQCQLVLKSRVRWESDQLEHRDVIIASLQRLLNSTTFHSLLAGTSLLMSPQSCDSAVFAVLHDGCIVVPHDWI